jgi:hypothetical protein
VGESQLPDVTWSSCSRTQPDLSVQADQMLAPDDDQEGRRLLLGKGAVLAHHLAHLLAAESDEQEQSALPLPRCIRGPPMREAAAR